MPQRIDLGDDKPRADGVTDDTPAMRSCLQRAAQAGGGVVCIPPGDYFLAGERAIAIPSHTTVLAHGARFHLPQALGDRARVVVFEGRNVRDFSWQGGFFEGHCFDHRRGPNTWEPNANTRIFAIGTDAGGVTDNILFRDVQSLRVAGAVINVEGTARAGSESQVDTYATNIDVRDCRFVDSGKFMWDYGLLWQILVWPEDYTPQDVDMVRRYFCSELLRGPVAMADGDDRVVFDNARDALPAGTASCESTVCFLGDRLPANIVRGRMYFVVESAGGHIRVAAAPAGPAIRFAGAAGPGASMIANLPQAFYHLFQPLNAGPGKGCIDLVCCRNTSLIGNRISALGDTMHVQRCRNNVIAGNQIVGSRMGAFFLAEFCQNSTVTGNTVDGTNGSRVVSIEKSNEDVTMIGNTFRGGGRGSWINQPQRLVMQGNIFINNTTKGERDPWRGRKSFSTGDYERWAEMYFTVHQGGGRYGPVILRDNLFVTGPDCSDAITFAAGGHDIHLDGNIFDGPARTVRVDPGCTNVTIGTNPNMELRER